MKSFSALLGSLLIVAAAVATAAAANPHGTPPGHGGTPPGHGGTPPGHGGNSGKGHPKIDVAADQIVVGAAQESPELTCRAVQLAIQDLVSDEELEFKNHGRRVRFITHALKRALRGDLSRKELSRGCFGCIVKQFAKKIPIPDQGICGVHDICEVGEALDPGVSPCVAEVCQSDADCCVAQWDQGCVDLATSLCDGVCGPTTTTTLGDGGTTTTLPVTTTTLSGGTTLPPTTTTVPVTTTTLPGGTTTLPPPTTTTVPVTTTTLPGGTTLPPPTTTTVPVTTTTLAGGTTTTTVPVTTTQPPVTTTTVPPAAGCPDSAELVLLAGTRDTCTSDADCEIGVCDTSVNRCQTIAELDTGWTGVAHDADITDNIVVRAALDCGGTGPACGQCDVAGLQPDPGNCRCANNTRQICTQPFSTTDPACGGSACNCYLGPPLALSAGNTPACIVNRFSQDVTGTTNVDTGDSLTFVNLRSQVFLGESLTEPCPYCAGDATERDGMRNGTCVLGANAGASCDVDAFNFTFPAPGGEGHSLDCFPTAGKNVSGAGLIINLDQTTGSSSLSSQVTCGFPPQITLQCPCGLCSNDATLPCNANTDCSAGGTCQRRGAFDPSPNACNGNCVDGGGGEGVCDVSGPDDLGCDAVVRANGEFFIQCNNNADCAAENIGVDAGNCTLTKRRECFLPTIVADGTPDPEFPVGVATFCIPPTANPGINSTAGLPGPGRVVSQGATTVFCGADVYTPNTGCP